MLLVQDSIYALIDCGENKSGAEFSQRRLGLEVIVTTDYGAAIRKLRDWVWLSGLTFPAASIARTRQ